MKFPFFATTSILAIFCFMLFIKSLDYGQAWAIVLSILGLLLFGILTIVALMHQLRQHEGEKGHH